MNFSVALCTYNGRPYISEQLDSVLSQTRIPDEIVVFDDNSSDGTTDVLDEYGAKHPDVFDIHYNEETKGVVKNFEQCIQACSGDLIALCDQDDVWRKDKLLKQEQVFQKHNPILVFHNSTITNEHLTPISNLWDKLDYEVGRVREPNAAITELVKRNVAQGATMCFKSKLIPEVTPIPPSWSHDYYIALNSSLCGKLYDLDEELLKYRQHSHQVIGAKRSRLSRLISGARRGRDFHYQQAEKWEMMIDNLSTFNNHDLIVNRSRTKAAFCQRINFERTRALIRDPDIQFRKQMRRFYQITQTDFYSEFSNGRTSMIKDALALLKTNIW